MFHTEWESCRKQLDWMNEQNASQSGIAIGISTAAAIVELIYTIQLIITAKDVHLR